MEITLGEFRSGTLAQQAPVQQEQVATRPNPSEIPPENPDPEISEPVEEVQEQTDEIGRASCRERVEKEVAGGKLKKKKKKKSEGKRTHKIIDYYIVI